jgi:hypothetical protein
MAAEMKAVVLLVVLAAAKASAAEVGAVHCQLDDDGGDGGVTYHIEPCELGLAGRAPQTTWRRGRAR